MATVRELNIDSHLPSDMMLLLAEKISVFDLPNFVLTSRWFAGQAEKWWKYFTIHLFNHHPPLVIPATEVAPFIPAEAAKEAAPLNCHRLFFRLYKQEQLPYRRHALRIRSGDIHQLLEEHNNRKYPIRWGFTEDFEVSSLSHFVSNIFPISRPRIPQKSLLNWVHLASEEKKADLLDFLHNGYKFPRGGARIQLSLSFFRTPLPSSKKDYDKLYCHLYIHPVKPLIAAIKNYPYDPALILLLLERGADIYETDPVGRTASDLLIDIFIQKAISTLGFSTQQSLRQITTYLIPEQKLMDYCKEHFPEMVKKTLQHIKEYYPELLETVQAAFLSNTPSQLPNFY